MDEDSVDGSLRRPRNSPSRSQRSKRRRSCRFSLFLLCLLICPQAAESYPNVCGSIDIRNEPRVVRNKNGTNDDFIKMYMNCTILEGTFSLSMISNVSSEEDFVTFPNLVEITGYLLVFNVKSLTSLARIFPNLRVIGGSQLIMNYALIIYQNPDLKDVGLPNLRVIRNGGVRISENPSLCYAKSIQWTRLLFGPINDVIVHDGSTAGEMCSSQCDDAERSCVPHGLGFACWNATRCQEKCEWDIVEKNGGVDLAGSSSDRCHDECLGGCFAPNDPTECVACQGFFNGPRCVSSCPPHLYRFLSRCITEDECWNAQGVRVDDVWKQFKPVNGQCVYDCPSGYEVTRHNRTTRDGAVKVYEMCVKCDGECPKRCSGKTVDSTALASDLRGCNIIEGNLDIQLRHSSTKGENEKLTEYFKSITTITGYLIIRFSPSLMSLSMFSNLTTIEGQTLYQDRYSLIVYENPNLKKLLPRDKLRIARGTVQVQNNRNLCFSYVESLMKGAGLPISPEDQSIYSNGDKAICEETTFDLRLSKALPTGFIIEWPPFNTTDIDHRKFLGYQVFYKQVYSPNASLVSIDSDRSVCQDSWYMHFHPAYEDTVKSDTNETKLIQASLVFEHVKPNAYYAIYVQTKMVNHPGAKNAISNMIVVKTSFYLPTPPPFTVEAAGTDTLIVNWQPPHHPNGDITHYIIMWAAQYRDEALSFFVHHACDHRVAHVSRPSIEEEEKDEKGQSTLATSTTPATTMQTLMRGNRPSEGTCSAHGCCTCERSNGGMYREEEEDEFESEGEHDFENAVQNLVFVPSCQFLYDPRRCPPSFAPENRKKAKEESGESEEEEEEGKGNGTERIRGLERKEKRRRRSHTKSMHTLYRVTTEGGTHFVDELDARRFKREVREPEEDKDGEDGGREGVKGDEIEIPRGEEETQIVYSKETSSFEMPREKGYLMNIVNPPSPLMQQNVTADKKGLTITGLRHYTWYKVAVRACQDVNVNPTHCSAKITFKLQRTFHDASKDLVNVSTVSSSIVNGSSSALIAFDAPEDPNGRVLGFKVTLVNVNVKATPIEQCINAANFSGGVVFEGLADGVYKTQIQTISSFDTSQPVVCEEYVRINNPGFFTLTVIISILVGLLLLLALIAAGIWLGVNKYYGKRVGEYIRQTITANPEYLSQFEIYKQDDWELPRAKLTLKEEIGRGTFGKVYRGFGEDLESKCGAKFGLCAVKTVSEDANPGERLHFLIEASVMKQFNTSFIIKLFGVVSDGQPVLVVMEMMEKGNLRDYLRSRRPDAEENVDNLPVPTNEQYYEWAAQIADGMAYLESLKFCHRDLAARNCMVGARDVVKIGDFGMARDIYYHEYYKPTGKRLMPVRWMAPESLKDGKFTLKSDVWSYGIVLYEMLTLAQQPYLGLGNDQVFNYIGVSRKVLERPTDCPDFWYHLMVECWRYQPRDRPTFRDIVELLREYASEEFIRMSWVLNEGMDMDDDYPLVNGQTDVVMDDEGDVRIEMRHGGRGEGWMGEAEGEELMQEEEDAV